jgi:hypothetical protein
MNKFAVLAIVALATLGLTGCVQLYSDTNISKDGSGNASFVMSLSPGMTDALKEMEELGMNENQDMDVPEFDEINQKDLEKAIKGHGVKITKFEKDTSAGNMKIDLAVDFEDLEGLSYVMGKVMGGDPGDGMGIYETADGNYVLKKAVYDFPPEPEEEAAKDEADAEESTDEASSTLTDEEKAQKQMALMGKMMGAMAELDIKFTITVPGEVIESNAPTVEGNTSIWTLNASNMMSQQDADMEPIITFSSKGLKIKPIKE